MVEEGSNAGTESINAINARIAARKFEVLEDVEVKYDGIVQILKAGSTITGGLGSFALLRNPGKLKPINFKYTPPKYQEEEILKEERKRESEDGKKALISRLLEVKGLSDEEVAKITTQYETIHGAVEAVNEGSFEVEGIGKAKLSKIKQELV